MRILHCFNWKLIDIISILDEVKKQGFEAIQINPIQPLKEGGGQEWWMSYQPIAFEIGNCFGTLEDLKLLCEEASKYDIRIFADVVLNYMESDFDDNLKSCPKVDLKLQKLEYCKNRQDVIHNCLDLQGLNIYQKDVENIIVEFLNKLIDCGVSGFKFNSAKFIGLPSEGYRFWPNVIYRLKKYGLFLYGDVTFKDNKKILDEYSNYMCILGEYDCSDRNKMVKYVESYDTFLINNDLGYTKNMPSDEIIDEYCNLINLYPNTLFYIRPFDESWKSSEIKDYHCIVKNNCKILRLARRKK